MQLFSVDATMFLKILKKNFFTTKVEKTTLKSCSEFLKSTFFFLTALTAQTAQTEEFLFQNVAYCQTVYRNGDWILKVFWSFYFLKSGLQM